MNYIEYLSKQEGFIIELTNKREDLQDQIETQFKESMPNLWKMKGLFRHWTKHWSKKDVNASEECYLQMEQLGFTDLHAELFGLGQRDFLRLILDANNEKFKPIFN
jgi:hypothetical protein